MVNKLNRRDLIKGAAMGVGAALLPAAAVPRLMQASVDGVGTVAATQAPLSKPISKLGEAEYFSPMVIESSIEQNNNLRYQYDLSHVDPVGVAYGSKDIVGRFTMYIENEEQARTVQKFMEEPSSIKLELHQDIFKYRFDAYVEEVTIFASAQELMTAEVRFRAISMEVIENGSA